MFLFLLLISNFRRSFGLKDFSTSFEDDVGKGSAKTRCAFQIEYNDEVVHNVAITCRDVTKAMTLNYVHTTDTLHKISLKFKIAKNGKTKIDKRKTRIEKRNRGYS